MLSEPCSISGDRKALVETTSSIVRQAALNGCLTCGILYAGLQTPLSATDRWITEEREEDVIVVIKDGPDFVQVYSRADAAEADDDFKYAAFTFYASRNSDKLTS